jgi:hypothetical protein
MDASSCSDAKSQRGATNSHIQHVFLSQSSPSSGTHASGSESDWPSVASPATLLSEESDSALGNDVIIVNINNKVPVHHRVCIYTHVCVYARVCVYRLCICKYVYIHTRTRTSNSYVCMCVCIYIYIYIYR